MIASTSQADPQEHTSFFNTLYLIIVIKKGTKYPIDSLREFYAST